jgi:hypothetical protein
MYSPSLRKILRLFALLAASRLPQAGFHAAALSFRNFALTFDQRIIMAQRRHNASNTSAFQPQQNRRQKCCLAANTLVR